VEAKTRPALPPGIRRRISVRQNFGTAIEVLSINSKLSVRTQRPADACAGGIPQLRAAAGLRVNPLRVLGALGNDVDDAVDRVRAPQRAARPADDFDAIDVLEQIVLRVPEHA